MNNMRWFSAFSINIEFHYEYIAFNDTKYLLCLLIKYSYWKQFGSNVFHTILQGAENAINAC